jgi:hypothetical protein
MRCKHTRPNQSLQPTTSRRTILLSHDSNRSTRSPARSRSPRLSSVSLDLVRALVILFGVLLASCASDTQVAGPYAATLSAVDIAQIRLLAATDLPRVGHHPTGPPKRLEAIRSDYVHVTVPIRDPYSDTVEFNVMKRRGRWIVDGPKI